MRRPLEDGLSLLAGAGIGVALMYLFDPDKGAQRRHRIAGSARQSFESARQTAGSALHHVSDAAQSMVGSAASHTAAMSERAAEAAREVARHLADRAQESVHEVADDAIATKRSSINRASLALGRDRDRDYVLPAAAAIGSLALGAGLFWAFDPQLGRSRRTWLRDKGTHCLREAGEFFRQAGVSAGNRLRGTVAEARSHFAGSSASDTDEKLCARVRSELGRVVDDMGNILVAADDGHIALTGEADGSQIESIGNVVLGTRGVRGMDNQLTPRGQAQPVTPVHTAM